MTAQLYLHADKTVLRLTGDNPENFLNDLLTAQIEALEDGIARAACLLSPQGRVLFDMLVLRTADAVYIVCLLYTSPSPRDRSLSRMPSSA